jgi:hypothetical protein
MAAYDSTMVQKSQSKVQGAFLIHMAVALLTGMACVRATNLPAISDWQTSACSRWKQQMTRTETHPRQFPASELKCTTFGNKTSREAERIAEENVFFEVS